MGVVNPASATGRRVLLRRLYAQYAEEPAFAALQQGDNPLVPGTGSLAPRLMFVGEAPGKLEQKRREPFVGASGRFLNEMLASVGLGRDNVWITNAVKYRPTDPRGHNRTPEPEELAAGATWLRREHVILGKPPMVMLGRHARRQVELGYCLRGTDLTIGEWFWMGSLNGFPMLPLYHPAYGIYQRANRPMMFRQFKAVLSPPNCFGGTA